MNTYYENLTQEISQQIAGNPNFTPEQWVEWLLRSARASASVEYKQEIMKRKDYYAGRQVEYLKDLLSEQFDDPKSLKIQPQYTNIVKQIIDTVSKVYNWGAKRELVDEDGKPASLKEQELWQYLQETMQYSDILKNVNVMVNLVQTVLVRPYYLESDNELRLDVLTPDMIDVIQNPQIPTEAVAVLYSKPISQTYLFGSKSKDNFKLVYHYWDAQYYRRFTADGNLLPIEGNEEGINPFGILPFVKFTNIIATEGFFVDAGYELINAQDNINIKLTQLNNLIKLQTFSIPVLIGYNATSDEKISIQPSRPITMPPALRDETQPDFHFVTPSPNIQAFLEEIDQELIRVARVYGLSSTDFTLQGGVKSGFALKMENLKLLERRQHEISFYERGEKRLFEVIKRVWNYYSDYLPIGSKFRGVKFSDGTKLSVSIPDAQYPSSPQEIREEWDWKLANKLATPIEYLMKVEHLTEQEAEDRWKSLKEWWDKNGGGFGSKFKNEPPQAPQLTDLIDKQAKQNE